MNLSLLLALLLSPAASALADPAPSPRLLPPFGDQLSAPDRAALTASLQQLTDRLQQLPPQPANANAEVFLKAVRFALENREFFHPDDAASARELLAEADRRLTDLAAHRAPWTRATGFVVRGYYSPIDGSPQPFALEIPPHTPAQNAPAWFWLQGRGESRTDLHFLSDHLRRGGEFTPPNTIVVHPWGRYCLGFKGPGEADVLDLRDLLVAEKRLDPQRCALAGFSMGGAGAWLLGAHYPDRWAVVHTGAGFVDVRRYQKLSEAQIAATPPWEQTLWAQNDVPNYTRNLLNFPVFSYSGEKDPQRASAAIMAEAFQQNGAALTHHIGPGMGHKYHPATRQLLQDQIQAALLHPALPYPLKLTFQTPTLDYSRIHWLQLTGLAHHWQDSRVDATLNRPIPQATSLLLTTTNTTSLTVAAPDRTPFLLPVAIEIDGQNLQAPPGPAIHLRRQNGAWSLGLPPASRRKLPGLQGPIDDAFTAPFLHVLPDRPGFDPACDRWVLAESAAQLSRWRTLFRGDARAKPASAVTAADQQNYHLILWGDPASNPLIAAQLPQLPLQWNRQTLTAAGQSWPARGHLPLLIYPNPDHPGRYLVLNSGPTFREAHSKTNSQQNPKLPDWAILDITSPPTPQAAGQVEAAGFFSETWEWQ